jgi:predicted nucleic acid-binding protein
LILVHSSVWIDCFNGAMTPQTDKLDRLLGQEFLAIGDLILVEVLQGFRDDADFERAHVLLAPLRFVRLGGAEIAVEASRNFRKLRPLGVTVRKTIDTVIATWCIQNGCQLLYSDRDFEPFVQYLGLRPP